MHEIKTQRLLQNLDRITSNNGKLTYESVWCKFRDADVWACVFALNIYDWKDLGMMKWSPGGKVRVYLPNRSTVHSRPCGTCLTDRMT